MAAGGLLLRPRIAWRESVEERPHRARHCGSAGTEPLDKLLGALPETIEVLAKTKRSFKSKTLGQLRAKLESLIQTRP